MGGRPHHLQAHTARARSPCSANPASRSQLRLVGKTAAETISVMLAVFARIEPALRKSITFDNDNAQHALLKTTRAMTTWFCDAYASWQKVESKTPMADCDVGCHVRSTSTECPTNKSRTSSSPLISRRENASV